MRVLRLGRIIANMNVKADVKLTFKLAKLIFFLLMYLHCLGCGWYLVVKGNEKWIPPTDYLEEDQYLYDDSILRRYLMALYHSVLISTLNEIVPLTNM
jgi:hypothetical protein